MNMLIMWDCGISLNVAKVWYKNNLKYAVCALCNDEEFVEMQKFSNWHLKCTNSFYAKETWLLFFQRLCTLFNASYEIDAILL